MMTVFINLNFYFLHLNFHLRNENGINVGPEPDHTQINLGWTLYGR